MVGIQDFKEKEMHRLGEKKGQFWIMCKTNNYHSMGTYNSESSRYTCTSKGMQVMIKNGKTGTTEHQF